MVVPGGYYYPVPGTALRALSGNATGVTGAEIAIGRILDGCTETNR